jgi:hypothetical protein
MCVRFLLLAALVLGCAHGSPAEPAGPWKVITSEHFVVRTDADPGRYRPVIAHLEDVHQALAGTFFPGVPLPRVEVLLFANQSDFDAVAPGNLLGFLTLRVPSMEDGLLVLSSDAGDLALAQSTAAHELAHRFMHAVNERVPRWLHEGFAEYVAALQIRDGEVAFDAATAVPSYVHFEDPIPLDRLLASGSGDFFGADARAVYMTAWILVRQLLGNPRAGMVDRLQVLIAQSSLAATPAARMAALRQAFGGADLEDIEKSLQVSYQAILRGEGPPRWPRTLAFTLKPETRRPWRVVPGDRAEISRLCAELREQRRP